MRILTTSSRAHPRPDLIVDTLDYVVTKYPNETLVFIHGGCPDGKKDPDKLSGDMVVDRWAKRNGFEVEDYPVTDEEWETLGLKAGPIRNKRMVGLGAELCLAFPIGDSKGTRGCASMAAKAGINTRVFELEEGNFIPYILRK